jgi:hypothetical protein
MNIVCPNCNKVHKLPDDKITFSKAAANCKKCGMRMIIYPDRPAGDVALNGSTSVSPEIRKADESEYLLTEEYLDDEKHIDLAESSDAGNGSSGQGEIDSDEQGNGQNLYAIFPGLRKFSPEIFDFQQIFTENPKKGYGTRENLLKFKIIRAVHEILIANVLNDDESVLRVAKGTAYFPLEIPYANGLMTLLSNHFAIICTDQRMIFINIDFRVDHPTRYVFQVLYEEIENMSRGVFFSSVIVQTRTGRNWNFTTVGRQHAKEIYGFVNEIKSRDPSRLYDGIARWQCCPHCYTPLPGGLGACPSCSAVFKSCKEALIRAMIMPGLGSLYLSYLPLGLMEMIGYLAVWLVAVVLVILRVPGGLVTAILLVLAYHGLTGIMSCKMANKGYLPQAVVDKEVIEDHDEEMARGAPGL